MLDPHQNLLGKKLKPQVRPGLNLGCSCTVIEDSHLLAFRRADFLRSGSVSALRVSASCLLARRSDRLAPLPCRPWNRLLMSSYLSLGWPARTLTRSSGRRV
jgi:hypothetical protein